MQTGSAAVCKDRVTWIPAVATRVQQLGPNRRAEEPNPICTTITFAQITVPHTLDFFPSGRFCHHICSGIEQETGHFTINPW